LPAPCDGKSLLIERWRFDVLRARDAVPNVALFNLRDAAGLTQEELANQLSEMHRVERGELGSVTANTISRWESGRIERPAPIWRRLLAERFSVSIEELGFTRPRTAPAPGHAPVSLDGLDLAADDLALDPRVDADQDRWREMRHALNAHRFELGAVAPRLYEPSVRLGATGLVAPSGWVPPEPVELASIGLIHHDDFDPPSVTGTELQTTAVRPLQSVEHRYQRYSHAVRDLDQPALFGNRLGYRLLDVEWDSSGGRMDFGYTTYFEVIDVYEALAHETAIGHLRTDGTVSGPSWRHLRLRRLIGDPFDLRARPVMPSINTLTIRMDPAGSPSLVLHRRDSAKVSVAGGLLHVMPAGMFQPSSVAPAAHLPDFDLWRNMMREYAEEFLGHDEYGGDGIPIDYDSVDPFPQMNAAYREHAIRVLCLGVAVDPLTLAVELLTVAVFDGAVYDELFADMVERNDEGTVVGTTVPFEEHTLRRLLDRSAHALAPAAAGCIRLAWDHRRTVLSI
jgi:transcriptional regulator with XRE-family HTH domain